MAALATTQRSAQAKERLEARTAARNAEERKEERAKGKSKEGSLEASMAKALGNLVRAQAQDKLARDVRRWMEVGVGIVEARALQQNVHSRASSKRVVSGPYVG